MANFSLLARATGYLSKLENISLASPGAAGVNFALTVASVDGLVIEDLSSNPSDTNAYENINIDLSVRNQSSFSKTVRVNSEIVDSDGLVVQRLSLNNAVTPALVESYVILPGDLLTGVVNWNVKNHPPGSYKLKASVYDYYTNALLSEREIIFNVNVTSYIEELELRVYPQYISIAQSVQLSVNALITNKSNVIDTINIGYELKDPSGAIVRSGQNLLVVPIDKVKIPQPLEAQQPGA